MDKKIKNSSLWVWIILVYALWGVIYFLQARVTPRPSVPLESGALNQGPISKEAEFKGEASQEENLSSMISESPQIINPQATPAEALTASKNPLAAQMADSLSKQDLENQVKRQGDQLTDIVPIINAPMTDQQILEGIDQQHQIQHTIRQITAGRDALAAQVMRNAQAAQSLLINDQQVIPSDLPRPLPPVDVVRKLKSHQLTAH